MKWSHLRIRTKLQRKILPDEKNIFDNPADFTVSDTRPNTAEDDLTEEEQAARAAENHTCEGITVSGIDLPWYVQFQVESGESYEFKNEEKANIFQSYEFKLWDLKNNTEYEIPDGQYVSVTIPVKEGYEYSIEHLLAQRCNRDNRSKREWKHNGIQYPFLQPIWNCRLPPDHRR